MTLHAWLSARDASSSPRRILHGTAALLLFALGLLSKPSLVPLPVFLALLEWLSPPVTGCPPIKNRFSGFLPLLFVWLPFCLFAAFSAFLTSAFHAEQASLPPPPLLSRLATIPTVVLFYLSKTLLPRGLSVLYPQWTAPLWLGAILALPFVAAAVWLFRRRASAPLLFLGAAFAALFLLPVSGLVAISYNLVADRYSFLPAIGLSIGLLHLFLPSGETQTSPSPVRPLAAPSAFSRFWLGSPLLAFLCCACAACAVATTLHLPVWRDSDALFLPPRRLLPDHYTIRIYDARLARAHGDFATARTCSARAAGALSDYYLFLGDVPNVNALDGPQAALSLLLANPPPNTSLPHWSVLAASAQLALDRPGDALATATAALPSANAGDIFRKVLLQIAMIASHQLGDDSSALAFARKAGAVPPDADGIVPGHFLPYYAFLWSNDDRLPALRYFRELAESSPTPSVLNNISWILASAFYSPAPSSEAVAYARRALDALPLDSPLRPTLLDTLSVALANDGQFDDAVSAVSDAIALLPPSSLSLPAMRRRLSLYRQSLPYRELFGDPVSPEKYAFDPHL